MFEQVNNQFLAFAKNYAETMVKANMLVVDSFEKLVELQMKTVENRASATADFVEQAVAVKGLEEIRTLLPKGVHLVKENAEKAVALGQESAAVVGKTSEQLLALVKGQFESANDTIVKASKVASSKK